MNSVSNHREALLRISMAKKALWRAKKALQGRLETAPYWLLYHAPISFKPVRGVRYFCQNAGSSGSMYIIKLLKANGISGCFHEKPPDVFDELGVKYFEGMVGDSGIKRLLIKSRSSVFFEANNRLFAVSQLLKDCFPDARFIHLHRDPRDYVSSELGKRYALSWGSGRYRYTSTKLNGSLESAFMQRVCNYWNNYNARILEDLEEEDCLSLKFSDLVNGNVDELEDFLGIKLWVRKTQPVNASKPQRKEGRYPPFESWSQDDRNSLIAICGSTMQALGYEL